MKQKINWRTLRMLTWSCDFKPDKCSSTMTQCYIVDPYKEGTFTPNLTSFSKEISSFFKTHGTSPSLNDQDGPTSPLFSCLGQCFFLVFEEIRSFLTTNMSVCFDDMCFHKED